jgi:hypothetical protein
MISWDSHLSLDLEGDDGDVVAGVALLERDGGMRASGQPEVDVRGSFVAECLIR